MLTDKIALVTGGASGIGAAVAVCEIEYAALCIRVDTACPGVIETQLLGKTLTDPETAA